MSNLTSNATMGSPVAIVEELIQETFEHFVLTLVITSSIALVVYNLLLNISQEIEYVWFKPFSLPTVLYILTRYISIFSQGLALTIDLLPTTVPIQSCNIVADVFSAFDVAGFIGPQGLLVARSYALCRGQKFVAAALFLPYFGTILFSLITSIAFPGCIIPERLVTELYVVSGPIGQPELIEETRISAQATVSVFIHLTNASVIAGDITVIGVCLYSVWGTWKLKREAGLKTHNDLVSVLLKQTVYKFFFAVLFSLTLTIIDAFRLNINVLQCFSALEQSLAIILISEFTLELRQRNSAATITSNLTLPPLRSVQGVLQHIHQTVLVEMGDSEDADVIGERVPAPLVAEPSQSDDSQSPSIETIDVGGISGTV